MSDVKAGIKAEILFEKESEFFTDQIIRIEGEYFFRHENGGSNGAYDARNFKRRCDSISRTEARRIALEFGKEPADVAEVLS